MQNRWIQMIEDKQKRKEAAVFNVGDTVDVHVKIIEGDKERIQIYNGTVIARRGRGAGGRGAPAPAVAALPARARRATSSSGPPTSPGTPPGTSTLPIQVTTPWRNGMSHQGLSQRSSRFPFLRDWEVLMAWRWTRQGTSTSPIPRPI